MLFEDIEFDKITVNKSVSKSTKSYKLNDKDINNSYDIKLNNKTMFFWTPILCVPFGLEHKYKNYFLNLELKDNNNSVKLFQYFIETFENKLIELLNIPKEQLNSQLRYSDNNQILYTKIYEQFNKILTSIKNKNGTFMNIFNIEKNCDVKVNLMVDKLWFINNIYYYKFKLKDIIVQ